MLAWQLLNEHTAISEKLLALSHYVRQLSTRSNFAIDWASTGHTPDSPAVKLLQFQLLSRDEIKLAWGHL